MNPPVTISRLALLSIVLLASVWLISCDSLFVDDGSEDVGITSLGGYFYFIDNEANELRMLDRNLNVAKSWPLGALASDTRFQGIAFDGKSLWLSVAGSSDLIYQVDASSDELLVLRSFNAPPARRGTIRDIAWDGTYLWAINSGSETYQFPPTLYKLNPTTGAILDSVRLPGPEPRALAAVGANGDAYGRGASPGLYIADVDLDSVYAYRTDKYMFGDGFVSPQPPRGASYIFPVGLAFDGVDFWLVNSSSAGDHLYQIDYKGLERNRIELPYLTPGPIVWANYDVRTAGPPTVTAVTPNTGTRGSLMVVAVTGTGFRPGDGLSVSFGAGITVTDIVFTTGELLEVEISVAADASFGPRDVTVTNPDGKSATAPASFTILSIDPLAGYIWVADQGVDSLYKIRIIDTTVVQSWSTLGVAPGGSAQGLTYDGSHIWLCAAGTDARVFMLNTSGATLSVLNSVIAPPDGAGTARETAFDGLHLWTGNSTTDKVYQQDTATGELLDSIATPGGEIRGLLFANDLLYCTDKDTDSVYAYNEETSSWTPLFTTPVPPEGSEANRWVTGMGWDGVNFWFVNGTGTYDYLFQVSVDGAVLRTYEVPNRGALTEPYGVVFTQE